MIRKPTQQYRQADVTQSKLVTTKLILPAFSHTPTANDQVSSIAAEYECNNEVPFTIGMPLVKALRDNLTFTLAVRSADENGVTSRYVLKSTYNVTLLYPDYNGETINADAVLEIWTGAGIEDAAVLSAAVEIETNYQTSQYSDSAFTPTTPTDATLSATVFSAVTTGPTNPFSDPLILAGG